MRILFISDIHGVPSTLSAALEQGERLGYDRLVLLGDLLYHGPRNGVPDFYDTAKVADILNAHKDKILAVRGNCDSEVDQLLLEFPMMSDYAELDADGERFFLTHGHRWNEYALPPVGMGTVLAHGHTHIADKKKLPCGITIFHLQSRFHLVAEGRSRSHVRLLGRPRPLPLSDLMFFATKNTKNTETLKLKYFEFLLWLIHNQMK